MPGAGAVPSVDYPAPPGGDTDFCKLSQESLQKHSPLKLSIKETLLRLQRNSRHKLDKKALTAVQGYSYLTFIPFVSRQSGVRTNLGLNNFTLSSVVNGDKPSANVRSFSLTNRVHWLDQRAMS